MRPVAILGLAAVLGLSACGSSAGTGAPSAASGESPGAGSAEQVAAAAVVAAKQASSARVRGTLSASGQKVVVDLRVVPARGVTGTVTYQGTPVRVMKIGTTVYARPSQAFLRAQGPLGAALARAARGRWIKADETLAAAAGLGDLSEFASAGSLLTAGLPADAAFTKVAGRTIAGQRTDGVAFRSAKTSGTLYVAATGPRYPLAVSSSGYGDLTLSDWGAKVPIRAPKAADVVDAGRLRLSKLG